MRWLNWILASAQNRDCRLALQQMPDALDLDPEQLIEAGWKERDRDQPELAHSFFHCSLRVAKRQRDRRWKAHSLTALADNAMHFCYAPDNSFVLRQRLAEEAIAVLRDIDDEKGLATALRVFASAIVSREQAEEALNESLDICKRIGDSEGVAICYGRLAAHCALFGDRQRGVKLSRKAIVLARVLGEPKLLANELFSLGIHLEDVGDERRTVLAEAAALYRGLGEKSDAVRCLTLCAVFGCDDNEPALKRPYLEEALTLSQTTSDSSLRSGALSQLAHVVRQLGETDLADRYDEEVAALDHDCGFPPELVEELTAAFSHGAEAAIKVLREHYPEDSVAPCFRPTAT